MKNERNKMSKFSLARVCGICAALVLFGSLPAIAAADDGPPPFTFKDRCVPYEVDHDFMLAKGVDPTKILTTFGGAAPPDDGTGNSGTPAPWFWDVIVDENGIPILDDNDEVQPIPCDEFHTHKKRTRYEGCHFYDGTPCYFTTNGQLDQDAFTDDAAGRRAFEIAEHFVIYEVVQNFDGPTFYSVSFCEIDGAPNPFIEDEFTCGLIGGTWLTEARNYFPAPIFTDPFAGGFAVGTQTKIMNAAGTYWDDDPLGLWRIGFIQFTQKASDCRSDFVQDDCVYMNDLTAQNGSNSQMIGFPLIYTGDEIFELTERGLASIRYRLGADGTPGGADGPRYILCPVHRAPEQSNVFVPGQDIIQGFPTHIEFQPPDALIIIQDFTDAPLFRGHTRISAAFPFGPTPPPGNGPFAEQDVYDQFDCLQRTGTWCP